MKLTKITAAAVAALTLGGVAASTGTAFASADPDQSVSLVPAGNDATVGSTFFTADAGKQAALADMAAKADPTATTLAVYRMYNPGNGEHFYTVSTYEAASLLINNNWKYEGTIGQTVKQGDAAVSRLYNPNSGLHYYTASEYEARQLMDKGWKDEGVSFIDEGTVNIYAAYNANSGEHNFTWSSYENNSLISAGWKPAGGMNNVSFHLAAVGTSFPAASQGYNEENDGNAWNGTITGSVSAPGTDKTDTANQQVTNNATNN